MDALAPVMFGCPPTAAKHSAPNSNFSIDQAQYGGYQQCKNQPGKEDGFKNKENAACIPMRIKWKEGAQAVIVGPIEEQVAQIRNQSEEPYPPPAH